VINDGIREMPNVKSSQVNNTSEHNAGEAFYSMTPAQCSLLLKYFLVNPVNFYWIGSTMGKYSVFLCIILSRKVLYSYCRSL